MARRSRGPIERGRDGFQVRLGDHEAEIVGRLMTELRELLLRGEPADPRLRRLFPTAYHDDAELDDEYQRLMREDLVASRLGAIEVVDRALQGTSLAEHELIGFMQSLNAVRLVLGTMLDVSEDSDPDLVADDDPLAPELNLYHYLGWLLDAAVRALSAR